MKVSGIAFDTGKDMAIEVGDNAFDEIRQLAATSYSVSELTAKIENLAISADAKVLLLQFSKQVIRVGEAVVKIGQKVLETVLQVIKTYPYTTFGAVFGAVAGALVTSIPLVGWVLGPLVTPLLVLFGISAGALMDFADKAVALRIKASLAQYEPLRRAQ